LCKTLNDNKGDPKVGESGGKCAAVVTVLAPESIGTVVRLRKYSSRL